MEWTVDDVITTDRYLAAFPNIYVKTDVFYANEVTWRGKTYTRPRTTSPYLITGHSDYAITDAHTAHYPDTVWFSVNASARQVHGLPLGITNNTTESESHRILGDLSLLYEAATRPCEPTSLVYMNFLLETYPAERKLVWDMFAECTWVTKGSYSSTVEGRRRFLADIRNHAFVLCPRGNGVDTVRLWETLYLGRIPIVKRDVVHKDWEDLPILFVDRWEDVTEELLRATQVAFATRTWAYEKLKIGYWIQKMREAFPKTLVYYTVGYSATYIDVLALSLRSLRASGYVGDIAVLCDESFLPRCKELLEPGILYATFPDAATPEQASMNKLRIYELPGIEQYERVLFLDSDILVHMNVNTLFRKITAPGILYVPTETTKQIDHTNVIWSLCSYTPIDLAVFQANNVHVFNAGCFAFVRCDAMNEHFLAVQYMMSQHTGDFFYEQSFLNVYFNRNGQTDRTLLTDENYVFPKGDRAYPGYLVHFAGDPGSGKTKLQRMTAYMKAYLTS
jgi:hypothetical protein